MLRTSRQTTRRERDNTIFVIERRRASLRRLTLKRQLQQQQGGRNKIHFIDQATKA